MMAMMSRSIAGFMVASLALPSLSFASGEKLQPNELGKVMILMYHQIQSPEREFIRTADNFRKDLENLYKRGYRLAHVNDLIDGKITTEEGRTPVYLTFDDAAVGQIDKIEVNGKEVWHPDSAIGIILEFARTHEDMGVAGTFYVNPFFAHMKEKKLGDWKKWMEEMVKLGFEFGNHTRGHPNLMKKSAKNPIPLNQAEVEMQIAGLQAWVHQYLPGYPMRTMALPFGVYPQKIEWAMSGTAGGETYRHEALMKVGADPAPSPFSRSWNPYKLPRVRAQDGPGNLPVSSYWIDYFDKHPELRLVSDGDAKTVTIPKSLKGNLRTGLPETLEIVTR